MPAYGEEAGEVEAISRRSEKKKKKKEDCSALCSSVPEKSKGHFPTSKHSNSVHPGEESKERMHGQQQQQQQQRFDLGTLSGDQCCHRKIAPSG